jgi:hypothetical protein
MKPSWFFLNGMLNQEGFWRLLFFAGSEMKPSWFFLNGVLNQEGFCESFIFLQVSN